MSRKMKVGVLGGTGMVGQRFITLLENHPWFEVAAIGASERSAGLPYEKAVQGRWKLDLPIPESVRGIVVKNVSEIGKFADEVEMVFCAVDMKKDEIRELEEKYAKAELPVISNNSAHRFTDDVPMIIPEVNPEHSEIIESQRKRLGTRKGFIAVKSNCSLQSYVPAVHPLMEYGPDRVLAATYQAISGAGKIFKDWPEIIDNVIPYIGGEEEYGVLSGREKSSLPKGPPFRRSVTGFPFLTDIWPQCTFPSETSLQKKTSSAAGRNSGASRRN